jgi:hypothetical protein
LHWVPTNTSQTTVIRKGIGIQAAGNLIYYIARFTVNGVKYIGKIYGSNFGRFVSFFGNNISNSCLTAGYMISGVSGGSEIGPQVDFEVLTCLT